MGNDKIELFHLKVQEAANKLSIKSLVAYSATIRVNLFTNYKYELIMIPENFKLSATISSKEIHNKYSSFRVQQQYYHQQKCSEYFPSIIGISSEFRRIIFACSQHFACSIVKDLPSFTHTAFNASIVRILEFEQLQKLLTATSSWIENWSKQNQFYLSSIQL